MDRDETRSRIAADGAIAVIRLDEPTDARQVGQALLDGGVSILEVTLTSPAALEMIRALKDSLGRSIVVGAGSVLSAAQARESIDAGASFIVSPITDESITKLSIAAGVTVLPGALTPTEIQHAHTLGADFVKVFPADVVGMTYFRSVLAPLPHLRLVPTGGVSLDNAGEWLRAGAAAVGVGSALVDKQAIRNADFEQLTTNARRLRRSIETARP